LLTASGTWRIVPCYYVSGEQCPGEWRAFDVPVQ
jgi:hypothetical protein